MIEIRRAILKFEKAQAVHNEALEANKRAEVNEQSARCILRKAIQEFEEGDPLGTEFLCGKRIYYVCDVRLCYKDAPKYILEKE